MKCIFCEFISGKRKIHLNGYPFLILNKTKSTICFLSEDIPEKGFHILLLPKRHFSYLEGIPEKIFNGLMKQLKSIVKKIRTKESGCNVLMNEGISAGQKINHIHFHIISRHKNDNIRIESWKRKKIRKKEFMELNKQAKILLK